MSYTVSRGYHTARQWQTVAIAAEVGLGGYTPTQIGALVAIQKLFTWTLEGLGKEPRKAPVMAGICALSVTSSVLATMSSGTSLRLVERKARKYISLIRATLERRPTRRSEIEELRHFLRALARHGTYLIFRP